MATSEKWFIAERVRALAMVLLTRRDDLRVTEVKEDDGFDLRVELLKNHRPTTRRFGIVLRGALSPVKVEQANKVLRPSVQAFLRLEQPSFPVCLLFFTMQDDQAYYTWLVEPLIDERGRSGLRIHDSADCKKLDNASLEEIVNRVNGWYDALFVSAPKRARETTSR